MSGAEWMSIAVLWLSVTESLVNSRTIGVENPLNNDGCFRCVGRLVCKEWVMRLRTLSRDFTQWCQWTGSILDWIGFLGFKVDPDKDFDWLIFRLDLKPSYNWISNRFRSTCR